MAGGILAPRPRMKPIPHAVETLVLTTGPLEKSLNVTFLKKIKIQLIFLEAEFRMVKKLS